MPLAGVCVSSQVLVTEYGQDMVRRVFDSVLRRSRVGWAEERCQKQERKEWEAAFHGVT